MTTDVRKLTYEVLVVSYVALQISEQVLFSVTAYRLDRIFLWIICT